MKQKNYRGYGFPYPSSHSQGTSEKESGSSPQTVYPGKNIHSPPLEAQGQIIGNIAAGNLADGDTIPQDIRLYRELEKGNTCCA